MPPSLDTCPNCFAHLEGRYCHVCGQEAKEKLQPLHRLLVEGLGDLFTFDSRTAHTLGYLFARPGFLVPLTLVLGLAWITLTL